MRCLPHDQEGRHELIGITWSAGVALSLVTRLLEALPTATALSRPGPGGKGRGGGGASVNDHKVRGEGVEEEAIKIRPSPI